MVDQSVEHAGPFLSHIYTPKVEGRGRECVSSNERNELWGLVRPMLRHQILDPNDVDSTPHTAPIDRSTLSNQSWH